MAALGASRTAAARGVQGIATGPVQPNWASFVNAYRFPDWFRDAKLGLWAHWGPQSVPEQGDWYGRFMYMQGHPMYEHHLKTYGHPADTGMIDIQHRWTADKWDPDALIARYKKAGAKYFVSLACHHDNLDCWDSAHHRWNATRVGPKRDVVGTWAKAARKAGLRFGVSNHSSHAWHWFQTAYAYDPVGPRAGERYDAYRLTAADGADEWWNGLDPQNLYTGPHMVAPDGIDSIEAMNAWHDAHDGKWMEHGPAGDPAYVRKWLMRQMDLIEKYRPDLCYFDDHGVPFGNIGMEAIADYYNRSVRWHGDIQVVANIKKLEPWQRLGIVDDVERGFINTMREVPWQTGTCIGDWFYNAARFRDHGYKSAEQVIQRLADVVSKNGNLLLSIPQRGDGSIDADEEAILDAMAEWMAINDEAIFASRPWRIYGEGPTELKAGMQNESDQGAFTPRDIRFTTKGDTLYAILLGWPEGEVSIRALGTGRTGGNIERVTLLGGGVIGHRRNGTALHVTLPANEHGRFVPVLRIEGRGLTA
ncbi:alpha-L-fucosidase [Stakelama saccharophila]|uniref:alpha-L-fucosidase n=1 Tax=Stakelama saccharophila TaxID=3075605 RepID=A0ABZ0BEB7_9SPHN|nr:alpha-L-fucosidase [Stakelama sp. W311]WNO55166.1 alpha-L-fucosidase [Stakelama sp. W311]